MNYSAIRRGRIIIQTAITAIITIAVIAGISCFASRMQLIPAIVSGATLWLILWFALTIIYGRIYCSTVCPLGALTDLAAWLTRQKKSHYNYSRPLTRLRILILVATVACTLCGITAILAILDPYSAFARIVAAAARPVAIGAAGLLTAIITLLVITLLAWRRGRIYCNTICPVGTLLGAISRFSIYHPDINTDLCTNCGLCRDHCSSQCIDLRDHTVDYTRCTVCFDCMHVCPNGAMTFRRGRHQLVMPMMQRVVTDTGISTITSSTDAQLVRPKTPTEQNAKPLDRRQFITSGFTIIAAAAASATETLSQNLRKADIRPLNQVAPPGHTSRDHFFSHCTGCGACVAACPSGVLRLSDNQFGIRRALTPTLDFSRAYCLYDCTRCTDVCPTKALHPLTVKEKHSDVIGKARVIPDNCILYADGEPCGRCARRCPRQAIHIATDENQRSIPVVDFDDCIGCGQCANVCPATPYKAIIIEGH